MHSDLDGKDVKGLMIKTMNNSVVINNVIYTNSYALQFIECYDNKISGGSYGGTENNNGNVFYLQASGNNRFTNVIFDAARSNTLNYVGQFYGVNCANNKFDSQCRLIYRNGSPNGGGAFAEGGGASGNGFRRQRQQ